MYHKLRKLNFSVMEVSVGGWYFQLYPVTVHYVQHVVIAISVWFVVLTKMTRCLGKMTTNAEGER